MKRFLPVTIFIILIPISMWYGYNRRAVNPDSNHTHADFAVWIDGKQLDFSGQKYMSTEVKKAKLSQDDLWRFLHLHDGNGHVIHRHKPGLSFNDFLSSIGFSLTADCLYTDRMEQYCDTGENKLRIIVNGADVSHQIHYIFNDGDQILLSYGADDVELKRELSLMTDDACLYSLTCPGHGKAPTESCIADPTVPCKQ